MIKIILQMPVLLLAIHIMGYSQDKIYLEKESIDGKVIEVNSDSVKYIDSSNSGIIYDIAKRNVFLIFNSFGDYTVVSPKDSSNSSQVFFQNRNNTFPPNDLIFTVQGNKIECSIVNEDDSSIAYSTINRDSSINKISVVGVIYKSGKHKILTSDMPFASSILEKFQEPNVGQQRVVVDPDNQLKNGNLKTSLNDTANEDNGSKSETKTMPVSYQAADTTSKKLIESNNRKVESAQDKNDYIDNETGVTFSEYEKLALEKTSELSNYLNFLCNKNTSYDKANEAIDEACILFVSENAVVELSSLNNSRILRFKIRDYLKRLKLVKYSKVDIKWANIQYVSKLRKAPDGTYRGVITFEQTFTGFVEDKMVYSDKTRKNIEVVLKTYKRSVEGKSKTGWDILLSDINVVETKNS